MPEFPRCQKCDHLISDHSCEGCVYGCGGQDCSCTETFGKKAPLVPGAMLIFKERLRQIDSEGWSADHDDEHFGGALALAAASYALPPGRLFMEIEAPYGSRHLSWDDLARIWPFDNSWDKRPQEGCTNEERIRGLVKAGALVAAEIDRLQRVEQRRRR